MYGIRVEYVCTIRCVEYVSVRVYDQMYGIRVYDSMYGIRVEYVCTIRCLEYVCVRVCTIRCVE